MKKLFFTPPFQTRYSIETDSKKLLKQLILKYGSYITEQTSPVQFSIRIVENGSAFQFSEDQESEKTKFPLGKIERHLLEHTSFHPNIFALHGAAVEWHEQCYLFLAATTIGKTTLTSYLTLHNCGYITDDCILLDRSNLRIHPYTSPIHLRDGGVEILQEYNALPQGLQLLEGSPSQRRWVYTPQNCIKKSLPLAKIFFIERTKHENALLHMSTTERISALMHAPITNYPINSNYLRFLTRLAKIDCFRLRYCDMYYVKELIQYG